MKNHINKIILGTAQIGLKYGINNDLGKPTDEEALELLSLAMKSGINILDTADAYGNAIEIIGRFNAVKPHFKVISKFHLGGEQLPKMIDHTLKTLAINQLEALLFHSFEDYKNSNRIDELKSEKEKGRVNKIGVSIYTNPQFATVIDDENIDIIQLPFNLLDNYKLRGVLLKKAKEKGKELHARSIFLQGLFFMHEDKIPANLSSLSPTLLQIKRTAQETGIGINELALNYVLLIPEIDKVLIGVDCMKQLQNNISIIKEGLPETLLARINEISVTDVNLLNPSNWFKI